MIKNKRAKQTLLLPSSWDKYRAINQRLNNNVVVSLDTNGFFTISTKS